MTGDEYMELLARRRDEWEAAHPARAAVEAQIERIKRDFPGSNPVIRPDWKPWPALLEWFIEPGDEDLVDIPEPQTQPKQKPKPRVYRSAASLREDRDRLVAKRDAITTDDETPDRAIANLSPFARSKAARTAGKRRFAKLDRDLEKYTNLSRRIESLDSRIIRAETRERRAAETAEGNQ
jgi:hypothetical protein